MSAKHRDPTPATILALVENTRYMGHVVLDGFGTAPKSFRTWNLRRFKTTAEKACAVERLLTASIRRYQPKLIVLGTAEKPDLTLRAMRVALHGGSSRVGVQIVERPAADGPAILAADGIVPQRHALARVLVQGFFRELRSRLLPRHVRDTGPAFQPCEAFDRIRYYRPTWQAVALGLRELAERHPFAAAALLQAEAPPVPAFHALIRRASSA